MAHEFQDEGDGRVSVPLVMLDGNMQVLLDNVVPCAGISLKWSPDHVNAVILVIHGPDYEAAGELGFKFGRPLG